MARFSEVFAEQVEKPASSKTKTRKIQFIHYSKLLDSAYQYRDRSQDMILALADLIKADGEILEPCIVRKAGAGSDSFELIAGHKRTLAAKYLVEEESMEEFAFIPCIEKTFSDIRAEFAVYSTNGYDEKTPYEIMREIEGMSRLLKEYPEEFPEFAGKGRLVEKLAAKMKISRSVISDYQNISHNLGERGMQSFQEGKIDKSAAVTLASMPEEKQEEILKKGLTKREEIKDYVAEQTREPLREDVVRFFERYGRKYLYGIIPLKWTRILKARYGDSHGGIGDEEVFFRHSPRGITFSGCDEITWKRFADLLVEYLPESFYRNASPEEKSSHLEKKPRPSSVDARTEEFIFDLTVGELITRMGMKTGSIKISNSEKSAVWKFLKEKDGFVIDKEGTEEKTLPGQMNVEEFL